LEEIGKMNPSGKRERNRSPSPCLAGGVVGKFPSFKNIYNDAFFLDGLIVS
jgi:hypothetical protein